MTRLIPPILAALAAALAAGPPAASAAARHDRYERSVVRHVNAFRAHHGLPRVRSNRPLGRAADRHSRDMLARDFFAHQSTNGTPFDHRIRRYLGAVVVGETLAAVSPAGGPATVVRMWVDSPPHRAILLAGHFQRIGVGRRLGMLGATPQAVVTADFASAR